MKKLFTLLFTATVAFALTMPAFAQTTTTAGQEAAAPKAEKKAKVRKAKQEKEKKEVKEEKKEEKKS